ncbi:unnamed protein product [Urochloa humidicola]
MKNPSSVPPLPDSLLSCCVPSSSSWLISLSSLWCFRNRRILRCRARPNWLPTGQHPLLLPPSYPVAETAPGVYYRRERR